MKRVGYLYEKIYDIENIRHAIWKASLGKREQRRVKPILEDIDRYAGLLHKMLKEKTFRPTKPHVKTIRDGATGKIRTIHKPNFWPDQCVHWALMLQLEPILMRGMYRYCCGSVPGRGTSDGQRALRKWLDGDPRGTKYCLKMDIQKFYPSINNQVLKKMYRRKIKDRDCLWLIDTILDSTEGQPIGYYTSQWNANFMLEELDHLIKEEWGVKYYIRYVDDLVLLGPNKRKLHKVRMKVQEYLADIGLTLKKNWQVFPLKSRDIDFLGIRFYRTKSTLRKRNALRIRRRVRKIKKKGYLNEKDASAVLSYWGWVKRTDSYRYYHTYIKPCVTLGQAKRVVSTNAKMRGNADGHDGNQRGFILHI